MILRLHWFVLLLLLYKFRKVLLPLIAIRIERLSVSKRYSRFAATGCFLLNLLLGFASFLGSAARRHHARSLRFPPESHHSSDITKSRSRSRLSCFPCHPDLLQLLCLVVGQCYNCNLLIVEVIVNRMCFLLCCCCCFCPSSSSSFSIHPPPPPPHNTRAFLCCFLTAARLLACCYCYCWLKLNRSWIKGWRPVPDRSR